MPGDTVQTQILASMLRHAARRGPAGLSALGDTLRGALAQLSPEDRAATLAVIQRATGAVEAGV